MPLSQDPLLDELIRFRCEGSLKERLLRVSRFRRKRYSEFLRDKLLELVEREEKSLSRNKAFNNFAREKAVS